MRWLIAVWLLLGALAVAPVAWADTYTEGLEVQCDQYQLSIREYNLTNGAPTTRQHVGTTVYTDHQRHTVRCTINGHAVEAEFQLLENTGTGECGGAYGGLLTLTIDGALIVKNAPHHSCTAGTTSIAVYPESKGAYGLEVCGHTDVRQTPSFSGCVRVQSDQLTKIRMPLNRWFPVGDLMPLVKFPSTAGSP